MKLALLAAFMVATCRHGDPTGTGPIPPPDPVTDFPPDGGDDAGTPAPAPTGVPESTCQSALEHLRDLECPPAGDSGAFLTKCAGFSASALSCLLATDTCATARACLEK